VYRLAGRHLGPACALRRRQMGRTLQDAVWRQGRFTNRPLMAAIRMVEPLPAWRPSAACAVGSEQTAITGREASVEMRRGVWGMPRRRLAVRPESGSNGAQTALAPQVLLGVTRASDDRTSVGEVLQPPCTDSGGSLRLALRDLEPCLMTEHFRGRDRGGAGGRSSSNRPSCSLRR
jgi:hypothetical protein